jgi:gliding motility-associatede transport system auxiliary component
MSSNQKSKPSFSPFRRWSIGFNVFLIVLLVFSVVVMINFLSRDYFTRFYWSTRTKVELSPLTVNFLKSMTNRVKVTLYYDHNEPFFSTISSLLDEYSRINGGISLQNVDYLRDAGAAQKVKATYKLALPNATNLVIFDCQDQVKIVDGNTLVQSDLDFSTPQKYRRKPISFQGEKLFTGAFLAVCNPKPLNAYFVLGHGEHRPDSSDETAGYQKFADLVRANYVQPHPLSLLGTNEIPADAHLVIISGPRTALLPLELEKLERYLIQGGRLLALFDADSLLVETGLEKILARWGVGVGNKIVRDPEHTDGGENVIVSAFSRHVMVNPLIGSGLYLIRPRPVGKYTTGTPTADAAKVENVAFSSEGAFLEGGNAAAPRQMPLIAVVEKGAIKGVITERGTTRIVVAGDSYFLSNGSIGLMANRDFANCAINWLLDRTQMLEGLGPRPIAEYRLIMTPIQIRQAQWLLLGGLPGAVMLMGCMVWLARRR